MVYTYYTTVYTLWSQPYHKYTHTHIQQPQIYGKDYGKGNIHEPDILW
jgi:hypothetical protein